MLAPFHISCAWFMASVSDSDTERGKERDFRSERNRPTQRNEQSSKSVSQEKKEAECDEKC